MKLTHIKEGAVLLFVVARVLSQTLPTVQTPQNEDARQHFFHAGEHLFNTAPLLTELDSLD